MILLEIAFYAMPYVLCAAAGAYLEAKFGGKAAAELAKLKADVAALKAKL